MLTEIPEIRGNLARKGRPEQPVQVRALFRNHRAPSVHQGPKVSRVSKDLKESRAGKAKQVIKDRTGNWAALDQKDRLETGVKLDRAVNRVKPDPRAETVKSTRKANLARRVTPDPMDTRVSRVRKAQTASRELKARRDPPVR